MTFLKIALYIFIGFIALMVFAVWYSQTPEGKEINKAREAKEYQDSIKNHEESLKAIAIEKAEAKNALLVLDEKCDGHGPLKLPIFANENDKFFFEEGKYKAKLSGWEKQYYFTIGKELNDFVAEVKCDVGYSGFCGIVWAMPLVREERKTPPHVYFAKINGGWRLTELPGKGMSHSYENGTRWVRDLGKDDPFTVVKIKKKGNMVTCYFDGDEVKTYELSKNTLASGDVGLIIGKRNDSKNGSSYASVAVQSIKVWELK